MKKYILIISLYCGIGSVASQITNSDLVQVTGGSFTMGNSSYVRESPTRSVNISTFYLSKYTITNAQFAQFINQYGSVTVKDGTFAGKALFVSDSWGIVNNNGTWAAAAGYEQYPAVKVSWYGANEFCKWNGGRLPTEAEWEFAAKGGPSQQAYTFSGSSTAANVAWFYDNSANTNKTVGTKTANSLGLYDMSGNVYQWCNDWFGRYGDFGVAGDINPAGPQSGASKVIRGGYRSIGSGDLHLTNRESLNPEESYNFVGFRIVRETLISALKPTMSQEIQVYPNPANNYLQLSRVDRISKIEMVDLQGKTIYSTTQPSPKIETSHMANGMYLLKIKDNTTETIRKIVVKH